MTLLLASAQPAAAGWLPIDTITNRPAEHDLTCESNGRAVACDRDGNIHVVWRGSLGGTAQLWYSRFDAATGQWSEDTVLFPDPRGTMDPVLALDSSGNLLVARFLRATRILKLARRSGGSGLWQEVDSLVCGVGESMPSISVDGRGIVYLVWQSSGSGISSVRFVYRDSLGWTGDTTLNQPGTSAAKPSVASSHNGNLLVAWEQVVSGSERLIAARRRVSGAWLAPETVFVQDARGSPCVASQTESTFHVVWVAGTPAQRIMYRARTELGWTDTARVCAAYRSKAGVSCACDAAGDVHIAWVGEDTSTQFAAQVFSRTLTREGAWYPQVMLTRRNDLNNKLRISLAAQGGRTQVAWTQMVGNYPAVRLRRYERVHDVGVTRIEQPAGTVDSGSLLLPAAWLRNFGDYAEQLVRAWFRTDSIVGTRSADSLEPGDSIRIEFDTLPALRRGWHQVCCSAFVAGDADSTNDAVRDSFFVRVSDVAVDTIIEPSGPMRWDTVRPRVVVRNNGNVAVSASCYLRVSRGGMPVHQDSLSVIMPAESAQVVTFHPWFGDTGRYTATCSVACFGDMHPENDTASATFELYWIDAGVESLAAPRDTVDSGVAVVPAASVRNHGNRVADVDVWMRVAGYTDSLRVVALAPGRDTLLRFSSWSAEPTGWNAIRCSVHTIDDMNATNDVRTGRTFVRLLDASADSIVEPDTVVRTDSVRPMVLVRNRGNVPARVAAWFWIAGEVRVYADSLHLELQAGQDTLLGFRTWPASVGRFNSCCSLVLAGDMQIENNAQRRAFRVVRSDVGVMSITWPTGWLDSGSVGQPRALVTNLGSDPESFRARFRIGAFYDDTVEVLALAPDETVEVAFARCSLVERGRQAVTCSTLVAGDLNPENNYCCESVFVVVRDGAATRILAPLEVISRGSIEPLAEVANRGNVADSAWVWFEIFADSRSADSPSPLPSSIKGEGAAVLPSLPSSRFRVYVDSQEVELEPGQTETVEFRAWEATGGSYGERCWIVFAGDRRHENDTACAAFAVARTDAAVRAIVFPCGVIQAGWVSPQVRVANLSDESKQIPVRLAVSRSDSTTVYVDSVLTPELGSMCSTTVTLRQWNATQGTFLLFARVGLAGDENRANDTLSSVVVVELLASWRWTELASVPAGEWGRKPRAGACLVSVGDEVMVLKGGGSSEWYSYRPADSVWLGREPMPPGPTGRRVRGGSALCWDRGRLVYALKGNKTREFYRYDVSGDSWSQMPSLPEHTPKLKYGAGLIYQPDRKGDKIYLVKGSGTLDFLVYEVAVRQWHARRFLPPGPQDRKARHGTGFAASGSRMFCLKGGTTEFYEYITGGDSWVARRPLPMSGSGGRLTRCRRGAALAADASGAIYAFKGGRTGEFWSYDVASDTWIQLDNIPGGNSRKKVHDGGALCCLGNRVYALKGGGSSEFWCYDATGLSGVRRENLGTVPAASERGAIRDSPGLFCWPLTAVHCPPFAFCGPVRSVVFDALGRRTRDAGMLEPGIYFCRTEQDGRATKVVILGRHGRSNRALITGR